MLLYEVPFRSGRQDAASREVPGLNLARPSGGVGLALWRAPTAPNLDIDRQDSEGLGQLEYGVVPDSCSSNKALRRARLRGVNLLSSVNQPLASGRVHALPRRSRRSE